VTLYRKGLVDGKSEDITGVILPGGTGGLSHGKKRGALQHFKKGKKRGGSRKGEIGCRKALVVTVVAGRAGRKG